MSKSLLSLLPVGLVVDRVVANPDRVIVAVRARGAAGLYPLCRRHPAGFTADTGVVQIRVTPKTRHPFIVKTLSISEVTWKSYLLNHASRAITSTYPSQRQHCLAHAVLVEALRGVVGYAESKS